MVAQRANQSRHIQEQLAHTVAERVTMPSQHDQVSYLRAQLEHREAQLEQVRAERDSHVIQEEEEETHMKVLSSETKDWKSRVVTETEQVLCQESAQAAHHATELQEAMDKQFQARWRQAEAELQKLCKSNSAQAQALASKLHETQLEHQQLYTAQERQFQFEAQTLKQSQQEEQQASSIAREREFTLHKLRRQAEQQPEILKSQWKMQLSQQASYKAEIHELYTEMLNMREKSEMQASMSAQMCRLGSPSRTVESEPENVLNTASPGRCSSWILPSGMMSTPDRPTTGGLQTPTGAPVQLGPSPVTQQYRIQSSLSTPPAQWGNQDSRDDGEEECELFGDPPHVQGDPTEALLEQDQGMDNQDELQIAIVPSPSSQCASQTGPRCVNGRLAHPEPPREDTPSTACYSSSVTASGGVHLRRSNPPCFGQPPPGIAQVPARQLAPPPPLPPSSCRRSPVEFAETYPRKWAPLRAMPKSQTGGLPDGSNNGRAGSGGDPNNPAGSAPSGSQGPGNNPTGGAPFRGGGPPNGNPPSGSSTPPPPPTPGQSPPQQSGGAGQPGGNPGAPSAPPTLPPVQHPIDPWAALDHQGSHCRNCCFLRTTSSVASWICVKCSKTGTTNRHLP